MWAPSPYRTPTITAYAKSLAAMSAAFGCTIRPSGFPHPMLAIPPPYPHLPQAHPGNPLLSIPPLGLAAMGLHGRGMSLDGGGVAGGGMDVVGHDMSGGHSSPTPLHHLYPGPNGNARTRLNSSRIHMILSLPLSSRGSPSRSSGADILLQCP